MLSEKWRPFCLGLNVLKNKHDKLFELWTATVIPKYMLTANHASSKHFRLFWKRIYMRHVDS